MTGLRARLRGLLGRVAGEPNAAPALPPELAAVARRFLDGGDQPSGSEQPRAVLLVGGVCTGKTTYRRARYATGFVVLDAAELFVALSGDGAAEFPGQHAEALEGVGRFIARRAIAERRQLVLELLSNWPEQVSAAIDALTRASYRVELVELTCPPEVAVQRNDARAREEISAYFAQPLHLAWLLGAS